jgi:hypothetical protein
MVAVWQEPRTPATNRDAGKSNGPGLGAEAVQEPEEETPG